MPDLTVVLQLTIETQLTQFNRLLQAKEVLLSSEKYGKDMTSVNTLLNTHLDVARELDTISGKVERLKEDAALLGESYPDRLQEVMIDRKTHIIGPPQRASKPLILYNYMISLIF